MLYAGSKGLISDLLKITNANSAEIHMDSGLEECKILYIEKWMNSEIELPNGNIIREMEIGETYRYLDLQPNLSTKNWPSQELENKDTASEAAFEILIQCG